MATRTRAAVRTPQPAPAANPPNPAVVSLKVRNLSTVVQSDKLTHAFRVFWSQVNHDFHKYWGLDAVNAVPYIDTIAEQRHGPWPADEAIWRATIVDYPYQVAYEADITDLPVEALGTVGFHYLQEGAFVHIVIFAALAQDAYLPWTLVFSHELLEALADPATDALLTPPSADYAYHVEVCDPVQFQAYPLEGLWVSNFVTPAWFVAPSTTTERLVRGGPYDFAHQLVSARQCALGGTRTLWIDGQNRSDTVTGWGMHSVRE